MSTVRIQVRRGTAAQWTSVNPILAAGEMGVESDSNLFKFGNGSSTWTAIAYANNSDVAIGEISQDAINTALTMGAGLTKTYNDGANTITIAVDSTVVTATGTQTLTNKTITSPAGLVKADVGLGNVDNTSDANKPISSATQTALDLKANTSGIAELAQDAVNTALIAGTGINKTYDDSANTLTVAVDTTVIADRSWVTGQVTNLSNTADETYLLAADLGQANGVASLNSTGKVPASQLDIAETVQDNIASALVAGAGVTKEYNDAANTITISSNISNGNGIAVSNGTGTERIFTIADSIHPATAVQTATVTATTVNAGTVSTTGAAEVGGNLTVTGNLTVNGTSTTVNSTNVSYDDPMIYMGDGNQSNVLDLGLVAAFNNGTYQHAGLVRDASDGFWKLFSGVTSEPGTTVDFTTYTKDNLEIGGLYADAARIGNVDNTEIQHLNGVTSPIQTQLDTKLSSIADGSVTASKIDTGAVTSSKIETGAVTSEKILNGTILNVDINAAAAIDYAKLNLNGAVLSTDLANLSVTEDKIATDSVTNTKVLDGTLTGIKLVDGAISAAKLGAASVTTVKITDGNITTAKLAPLSVTEAKLADGSVSADKIAASAVTTAKLADGHVTEAKLADGSVTVAKIADGSVSADKIAASAVTTAKLADGNVTDAKLANLSVTEAKIANSAVTEAKLAANAVTETKLAANAVTTGKIAEGTIINADINEAAEIAKTKIAGTAVTLADTGSVTNSMLAGSIGQNKVVNLTSDLAAKATIDAPTFTGAVVLPATTSIGLVDGTELGYVNGVTSPIQTQLTALGSADTAHSALTANVHGIADTSVLATATTVATAKSEAIAAAGTAADTKVSTAVAALTKSSVGLANVNNTADADKPVSSATQTELNLKETVANVALKAPLASPALTGTPTAPTAAAATNTTQIATTAFVRGEVTALVNGASAALDTLGELAAALTADEATAATLSTLVGTKAPIASPTFTGTVTIPAGASISGFAPLASPTFTGTSNVAALTASGLITASASGVAFTDGTQTKSGVPSITTFGSSFAATATLAAGEQDKFIPVAGTVVITLPASGYSTGQSIDFYQASGTGASFAATNSVVGTPGLKFRTTNSVVTAMKTAAGWLIFGDLSA